MKPRHPIEILVVLTAVAIVGCSSEAGPLSPTPDQDPARHARAVVEMDAAAQRNKEAEARFYRKLATSRVASAAGPVAPEGDQAADSPASPQGGTKKP